MRPLTLINTLEYYDVPQILVAADATGTNYLCTLYKNDSESGYLYLGVQISEPRLMAFIGGQLNLRDAYIHPEVENALYVVTAKQEMLSATTILQPQDLTEDMQNLRLILISWKYRLTTVLRSQLLSVAWVGARYLYVMY